MLISPISFPARFSAAALLTGGLLLGAAGLTPAAAQSFDCAAARRMDELAICRVPALARLDEELATRYRQEIDKPANPRPAR